jgi:aryl-alcohol dehydrogenase-like predicted oxidoreductase
MQKRTLGSSGIEVGAIGLGCMGMNWAYGKGDDDESVKVIHRAIELGVTLFDTADAYGPFTNEELVGKALKGYREKVTLATKCGLVVTDREHHTYARNAKPAYIKAACEASLRRLGVETIDLYQLHRPDPEVAIEESVAALAGLVKEGKVRAIGLSECDVPTLERAYKVYPFATLQSELSLWTRDALPEVLPWCKAHNVAFLPFSPLGRGFLTGQYRRADSIDRGDFRANMPRFQEENLKTNLGLVERVENIAARLGATPAQVALAWVLAQGAQVVPIPGTKRRDYLEENLGAANLTLSAADLAELDSLPPAAGSRYQVTP